MSDDSHSLQSLKEKAKKASLSHVPVRTFMSKSPVAVPIGTKIYSAIQMLAAHNVGSAPVVDLTRKIVGVISEHDLLIQTATKDVISTIEYTTDVITVTPETSLQDVLVLLYKKKVRRVPVVDHGIVVGTVTRMDVLGKLIGKENLK